MEQRRRRPHPTRADQSRPEPTKQPPDPLTESDLLRFTMEQRRRRPHPTRADQSRPSNHQTLQRSQIYCDLQWNSVAGAHTRPEPTRADQATTSPSNGVRSTAIYNGTASTRQPPHPLTESDLLRFTMEQRRRRPHPTRADQSRPEPTKQPPDPLTESDLLRFTMEQRRPEPTTTLSNGVRSTAIYNGTASPAPTPDQPTRADQSRPSNHQTL